MKAPLSIGIIGMGGFAGSHHATVARLQEKGQARLLCTCDPRADAFQVERQAWRFAERGVRVFSDYRDMIATLGGSLDMVVIPTPINLHASMHEAVTARGIPAYVEKPPTLDHAELGRMIAADTRARLSSVVGFNFIIEKSRLALKERLVAGEFGAVRGGTLRAQWPRPSGYFARNPLAGRLMLDGKIVLDSCFGNAMAHFVHNMLFWADASRVHGWAEITAVRAELYRVHPIEGADTFFVEADLQGAGTHRFALTHTGTGASTHCETVLCEKAVLRYTVGSQIEICWNDGRVERTGTEPFDGLAENHLDYYSYLRGEKPRPATTLADARVFVALNDLAHVSSGRIAAIPPRLLSTVRDAKEQKDYVAVDGLARTIDAFLERGEWPGGSGWERDCGEVVTLADLDRFEGAVRAMAAQGVGPALLSAASR